MKQATQAWAQEIRAARKRLGETQTQFAERFKVAKNTVSRWETGTYDPSAEVMWWLSHEGSEAVSKLRGLLDTQGAHGNWDYDPYMHGMYNGMELMLTCLEDRKPQYRSAPEQYLIDRPKEAI